MFLLTSTGFNKKFKSRDTPSPTPLALDSHRSARVETCNLASEQLATENAHVSNFYITFIIAEQPENSYKSKKIN